ncbi:BamA/TamA family outer membrane protein, partial [bacterium]|nr:BamA/TamA family outer membrane protein [candidate division CSSED10-310 bacterium]
LIGSNEFDGDIMLLGNIEYRHPLFWGLEGVLFLDSGNVFNDSSDVSIQELKSTLGVGMRFMTPVGPVGLDYGYNIMRDDKDPADRWSFVIGHTF